VGGLFGELNTQQRPKRARSRRYRSNVSRALHSRRRDRPGAVFDVHEAYEVDETIVGADFVHGVGGGRYEVGWPDGHFLGMVLRNTDEDAPRLAPRELALHLTSESTTRTLTPEGPC